ncbi:MAG: diphosphate--fructose-6-phosphate 1-phosphotransferase [Spirochaetes bacterium GWD1_27_9]|nr:MAG: diphosphate--fructose-6-phosphate 1-phosphotransferase [Spirochaetes bacterium GWB1_27_13]OHD24154.1 MAG: diphosphate--fructose-6-phosphate 1-phosphotransferase [Spirochaetes bacterium GWC1_27_15]OHD28963.1 MAG: diphosphate--fructose-6-phosphate 1-phosphotransferase [Spirochaetes bacterium GWD1_27_9]
MKEISALQKARYQYQPKLPNEIKGDVNNIVLKLGNPTESIDNKETVKSMFSNTYGKPIARFIAGKNPKANEKINVGVILSGGQAPGGHNVIAGIFDGIKKGNKDSKVIGFLGGPSGIIEDKCIELTDSIIDDFRNTGGFDIIGSGRTKLETEEQFDKCIAVCKKRDIKAVVIIGGDDSNTNAALLAEYFMKKNAGIQVIGVPKTIDGDLKNEYIETSFGFDTATKVYSELIGNIERDANSAKKYWHFIKLMGRSASHIALECALQTQPNIAIVSEEVEEKKQTLTEIVSYIANVIMERGNKGENFGIILIPEGLIEFVPEMKKLISELNDLLAHHEAEFAGLKSFEEQASWLNSHLSGESATVFKALPLDIQKQLLMDRDPHGNVQVSRIETEKLLIEMVTTKLNELKVAGKYKGKFSALNHFFGYEGRCAAPSNFDADYCYSLGLIAFLLIVNGLTGYMSSVSNLSLSSDKWVAGGIPTTMMFNMEQRHGSQKPVIKKALVDLNGKPFKFFVSKRAEWAVNTSYLFPGAIQYYGPTEVCDQPTKTLILEHS